MAGLRRLEWQAPRPWEILAFLVKVVSVPVNDKTAELARSTRDGIDNGTQRIGQLALTVSTESM